MMNWYHKVIIRNLRCCNASFVTYNLCSKFEDNTIFGFGFMLKFVQWVFDQKSKTLKKVVQIFNNIRKAFDLIQLNKCVQKLR